MRPIKTHTPPDAVQKHFARGSYNNNNMFINKIAATEQVETQ